jgi:hypothetical protein
MTDPAARGAAVERALAPLDEVRAALLVTRTRVRARPDSAIDVAAALARIPLSAA